MNNIVGSLTLGGGGGGLGMCLSKSIVDMHGGRVSVYSEKEGHVTTFRLYSEGEGHVTTFRLEIPMTMPRTTLKSLSLVQNLSKSNLQMSCTNLLDQNTTEPSATCILRHQIETHSTNDNDDLELIISSKSILLPEETASVIILQ